METFIRTFGALQPDGTYVLSSSRDSLITSILSVGTCLGALCGSMVGDRIGRRFGIVFYISVRRSLFIIQSNLEVLTLADICDI